MKYCEQKNIIHIQELLNLYNNFDVEPMLQARLKQKELFHTFNLDMFYNGYSLPALSENIMFQFSIKNFESTLENIIPPINDEIPTTYPTQKN